MSSADLETEDTAAWDDDDYTSQVCRRPHLKKGAILFVSRRLNCGHKQRRHVSFVVNVSWLNFYTLGEVLRVF